jgi:PAS domain S-box-containing protein
MITNTGKESVSLVRELQQEIEEQKRKVQEYDLLLKLSLGITTSKNIAEALQFTLQTVCEQTAWTCGDAWVPDATGKELKCVASYCDNSNPFLNEFVLSAAEKRFKKGNGLAGGAWSSKNMIWVEDIRQSDIFYRREEAYKAGIRSAMALPVPLDGEVLAVLAFYLPALQEEDALFVEMITAACGQLGLVIKEKQTEDMLRYSELRFRSVVQSSPEAIILSAEDGRINSCNRSAEEMLGYRHDEFLSLTIQDMFPERYRLVYDKAAALCRNSEDHRTPGTIIELYSRTKEGLEFPVEISIACWEIQNELFFSTLIRDISVRQIEARSLLEQSEMLKDEVLKRKNSEALIQAHADELKQKNEELEQFAYVASHDLQEPLRMVSSYMQLLMKRYQDKLDDDARQFIGFAVEGATRMQALINDLLTYSRIGSQARPFAVVDMNTVMDIAKRNLEITLAETDGRISYDTLPLVKGDEIQLVQLMQNLLSNALKFRK